MQTPMPTFAGLNHAPVFEKGNPLKVGTFDLEITRVITKRTQKSGEALIVEFVVLNNYGHLEHKPGDKTSWFQKLSDTNVAFPAIKAFLVAALGYDYQNNKAEVEAKVAPKLEAILTEAIGAGNAPGKGLNGTRIHVSTWQKKTLQNKDFTVHDWSPFKDGSRAAT